MELVPKRANFALWNYMVLVYPITIGNRRGSEKITLSAPMPICVSLLFSYLDGIDLAFINLQLH
jgi:hypothetical protein